MIGASKWRSVLLCCSILSLCWRSFTHFFLSQRPGTYVNLSFSHSWKKVETLINLIIYFKSRKPDALHFRVGKKRKQTVDCSTGDHSIDLNPGLPLLHFRGCFFNLILYDYVQSFFHIFVMAVKCLPFLEVCFIFNFQQLSHALSVRTWKKKRLRSSRTPVSNCQDLLSKTNHN